MNPLSLSKKSIWWRFTEVSRIHIVAIAAMGVFTFGWLFTGTYPWLLTFICALDWYIVNLLNMAVDLKEDRANRIAGIEFVRLYKKRLTLTIFLILLISLVAVHLVNPAITVLRITCHGLGLFYNWPLLPGGKRLKELYFWKNTASAVGFLITLFGYPLATFFGSTPAPVFPLGISWPTIFCTALFFFIFEISYEIIYDLRDIGGDKVAGLKTYPVVHGERKAVYLVDFLMAASIAVLIIGYLMNIIPWRILIMAAAPALQFIMLKSIRHQGISARFCIGITWMGTALLLIYHLWIIAELPGAGL